MINDHLYLRAQLRDFGTDISLALLSNDPVSGKYAVAEPAVMRVHDDGELITPAFHLSRAAGQVLMDDLWAAGLRPTEGAGSAGALAATQAHLKDLQQLVEWAYNPENAGPAVIQMSGPTADDD